MKARACAANLFICIASLVWPGAALADSPARVEFGFSSGWPPGVVPADQPPGAAALAICHDGLWEDAEFCGRDAYLNTAAAELNHDCYSDAVDFGLFGRQWMLFGPGLSADLNGDGSVFIIDLELLRQGIFRRACPGTPSGMQPDQCQGSVALSFSSDPTTIVREKTIGAGTIDSLYVVVDGYSQASFMEIGVVSSENIWISGQQVMMANGGEIQGWGRFDIYPRYSYAASTTVGQNVFLDGPRVFSKIRFFVSDSAPAWIKLEGFPIGPGVLPGRLRWTGLAGDHSVDFASVLNAGINGSPPPGVSTCGTQMDDPCSGVEPICDAGGPYSGEAGSALEFDGSASYDPDPGGSVVAYFWDFGDGLLGIGALASHVYELPGVYTVTLTVTDASGRFSSCPTSADVNALPLCDAGGPYSGEVGETITFDGRGSQDPDGTIVEYQWDFGDGTTGTGPTPQHTYAGTGSFTVALCVTDDRDGVSCCSTTAEISEQTAVGDDPLASAGSPQRVALGPIRPNPFNPSTLIRYELPEPARVVLQIYDVRGRNVRVLVDGGREAGYHAIAWNGEDEVGRAVRSGVYICRLEAGGRSISEKIVLAR